MVQRSVHDKDYNFVFYNIRMILCCREGRDLYQSEAVNQPRMRKMSYQYEDIQSQMFCILLEGHSRYYHTIFMIHVGYCVTNKSHTEDVGQFSPLLSYTQSIRSVPNRTKLSAVITLEQMFKYSTAQNPPDYLLKFKTKCMTSMYDEGFANSENQHM